MGKITKERLAEWRANNKDRLKLYSVVKNLEKYKMTLEEYNQLVEEQSNTCAICSQPEKRIEARTGLTRRLCVDHCHKTNKVRALLCSECNTAIGLMKDDPEIAIKISEYLIKHS